MCTNVELSAIGNHKIDIVRRRERLIQESPLLLVSDNPESISDFPQFPAWGDPSSGVLSQHTVLAWPQLGSPFFTNNTYQHRVFWWHHNMMSSNKTIALTMQNPATGLLAPTINVNVRGIYGRAAGNRLGDRMAACLIANGLSRIADNIAVPPGTTTTLISSDWLQGDIIGGQIHLTMNSVIRNTGYILRVAYVNQNTDPTTPTNVLPLRSGADSPRGSWNWSETHRTITLRVTQANFHACYNLDTLWYDGAGSTDQPAVSNPNLWGAIEHIYVDLYNHCNQSVEVCVGLMNRSLSNTLGFARCSSQVISSPRFDNQYDYSFFPGSIILGTAGNSRRGTVSFDFTHAAGRNAPCGLYIRGSSAKNANPRSSLCTSRQIICQ